LVTRLASDPGIDDSITDRPSRGHLLEVPPLFASTAAAPQPAMTTLASVPTLDGWTFERVYDECFDFVWRTVRRLGIIDAGVDDVVQDVFLVVHRRLGDFEGRSSIKSWLFAITVNAVRDARRSLRRKPGNLGGLARSSDDPDAVAVNDGAHGPYDAAAQSEAVVRLHAILDAMSEDRREVLVLAELEEMSVPDIADAVGANVNTIYSRLRAARVDFEKGVARMHANDARRAR
jgi:RNA polymerase sigma-70 factor (ECF subfamily)